MIEESNMRRMMKGLGLLLASLALPTASGQAHHSYAMFDMQKSIELKATVTQFKWTNPHAWITVTVKDKAGKDVVWNIEMNSPNNLALLGWKRSSLKTGDQVTITVHPLKGDKAGGSFMSAVLANGSTLKG
jgi:hypothetical protein